MKIAFLSIILLFLITNFVTAAIEPRNIDQYWQRGDANDDGKLDLSDAVYGLKYLFSGGGPIRCLELGDLDNDGKIALNDPIYLLNHLFQGGHPPATPENIEEQDGNDRPLEIGFLYFDYAQEIPEIELEIPITLSLASEQGIMKYCKISAYLDADKNNPKIEILEVGHPDFIGNLPNPLEFIVGDEIGENSMSLDKTYLLEALCKDDKGTEATTAIKIKTIAQKKPRDCTIGDICCSKTDGAKICIYGDGPHSEKACNDIPSIDPNDDFLQGQWNEEETPETCNIQENLLANNKEKNQIELLGSPPDIPGNNPPISTLTACCEVTCSNGEKTCAQTVEDSCDSLIENWIPYGYASPSDLCDKKFPGTSATLVEYRPSKTCDTTLAIPKCDSKNGCEVESIKILRRLDQWGEIPRSFRMPRPYMTEVEIINKNKEIKDAAEEIGISGTAMQIPKALDANHNHNQLLGFGEGWVKGTDVKFEKITKNRQQRINIQFLGDYKMEYSFVVKGELKATSDPKECEKYQFTKITAKRIENGVGKEFSKYIGVTENKDQQGNIISTEFLLPINQYLFSSEELKKEKSLHEMEGKLPNTKTLLDKTTHIPINALNSIQESRNEFKNLALCSYDSDSYCADDYREERSSKLGDIRKDLDALISWPIIMEGYFETSPVVIRNPMIIWHDSPGLINNLKYFALLPSRTRSYPLLRETLNFHEEYQASFIMIIEDEKPRPYSENVNGQLQTQSALHRWLCELEDIHIKSTGGSPKRYELIDEPTCKCYPQRKKSPQDNWERIKGKEGDPINSETGFIEKIC